MPSVVILDYGSGNLRSAERAVERAGADVEVTADPHAAVEADGLRSVQGDRIVGKRLAGSRPVLGICVGMQILFDRGVEHGVETAGAGEWPGTVERLRADVLPHMGWNTVRAPEGSRLFDGIDPDERFYFVHSYAAREWPMRSELAGQQPLVTWAHHGEDFVAAVENGALCATQFHPEKSGDAGAQLLRNWLGTL